MAAPDGPPRLRLLRSLCYGWARCGPDRRPSMGGGGGLAALVCSRCRPAAGSACGPDVARSPCRGRPPPRVGRRRPGRGGGSGPSTLSSRSPRLARGSDPRTGRQGAEGAPRRATRGRYWSRPPARGRVGHPSGRRHRRAERRCHPPAARRCRHTPGASARRDQPGRARRAHRRSVDVYEDGGTARAGPRRLAHGPGHRRSPRACRVDAGGPHSGPTPGGPPGCTRGPDTGSLGGQRPDWLLLKPTPSKAAPRARACPDKALGRTTSSSGRYMTDDKCGAPARYLRESPWRRSPSDSGPDVGTADVPG